MTYVISKYYSYRVLIFPEQLEFSTGVGTSVYTKRSTAFYRMFGVVKGRFYTTNECRELHQILEH